MRQRTWIWLKLMTMENYFHGSINADTETAVFSCQGLSPRDHYQAVSGKLAIKIHRLM